MIRRCLFLFLCSRLHLPNWCYFGDIFNGRILRPPPPTSESALIPWLISHPSSLLSPPLCSHETNREGNVGQSLCRLFLKGCPCSCSTSVSISLSSLDPSPSHTHTHLHCHGFAHICGRDTHFVSCLRGLIKQRPVPVTLSLVCDQCQHWKKKQCLMTN